MTSTGSYLVHECCFVLKESKCTYQEEAKGQWVSDIQIIHCRLPDKTALSQHKPSSHRNRITTTKFRRWEPQISQPSEGSLQGNHHHHLVFLHLYCLHLQKHFLVANHSYKAIISIFNHNHCVIDHWDLPLHYHTPLQKKLNRLLYNYY